VIPKYFNLYNISDDFDVKNFFLNKKIVIYSIDIETDYNGSQTESLKYIDKVLNIFNELKIPLSIFLEGSLIQNERSFLNNFKNNSLLDLNLHCYDHQTNGDTKDSLNKSLDLFTEKFGYKPSGYRANSYHLNKKLLDSLINEDFKWDSSILPAFSIGGNISKTFMKGDYFKINNLYEFPLAHYKGIRFAYNHSNQMILKKNR